MFKPAAQRRVVELTGLATDPANREGERLTTIVRTLIAPASVAKPGNQVSRFWSELVAGLSPYVPGEQPKVSGLVKLNTNESPFGPSPKALQAISAAASESLRLYPDPNSSALCDVLAARHNVSPDEIFVGNGSDEVLAHTFAALLKQKNPLRFPDITYSFYPVYCRLYDIAFRTVPLDNEMRVRVDDYLAATGPVIIANPNAPTGVSISREEISRLAIARAEAAVVVDEAYVDFGGQSAVSLIGEHPNLLVIQTMSKSRGLAGLRVGYAIGHSHLIDALKRVKDSFNSYPLGRPAQAGALASVEDERYFQQTRTAIIENRSKLTSCLEGFGFSVLPSQANFVFARHASWRGRQLAQALRERAVLVRHFTDPRVSDYLRITVGSAEQLDRLAAVLMEILAAPLEAAQSAEKEPGLI